MGGRKQDLPTITRGHVLPDVFCQLDCPSAVEVDHVEFCFEIRPASATNRELVKLAMLARDLLRTVGNNLSLDHNLSLDGAVARRETLCAMKLCAP
jgi:hypothetical protein